MSGTMIRSLSIALVLIAGTAVIAAPTRLGLKFVQGEQFDQAVQIKARGSVGPEGQQTPLDMTMNIRFGTEVLSAKPDGAVSAKVVLKQFRVVGMPGAPEMDLSEVLSSKTINVTLDRKGQVIAMEGLDDLSPGGMPGQGMFDRSRFDYPYFPDHPVEIGQTWQHVSETALPGSSEKGKRTRNYVLRSIKEVDGMQVAIIGLNGKTTIQDATRTLAASAGANVAMREHINSMTIEQDGETLLDIGRGRIMGARSLIKINGDSTISTTVEGQQFPGSMETRVDWEVTETYIYGGEETPDLSALYTKRETTPEKTDSTME